LRERKRAIATLVCADDTPRDIAETIAQLDGTVERVSFHTSSDGLSFTGIESGTHLTGPVLLLRGPQDPGGVAEALEMHMAPFAPLTVCDLAADGAQDRAALLEHVVAALDETCRAAAERNMDLRRQVARLRVELETSAELIAALKAQNATLGGETLAAEVLRWGPSAESVRPGPDGVLEQRLPRELRGTPLGALAVLAANSDESAHACHFEILDDDTEAVQISQTVEIPPGQSWVLLCAPDAGLTLFDFRRLRLTLSSDAGPFVSFRLSDAVEPVEALFVNEARAAAPLALRVYSGPFHEPPRSAVAVDGSDDTLALPIPPHMIDRLTPLSQIEKPEKWFVAARGRAMVHPSRDDVSLVGGAFQQADYAIRGISAAANLLDPKAHATMFRYLALAQADDAAVLDALRADAPLDPDLEVLDDSGWVTLLPQSQAMLPTLRFGATVHAGQLYLATRPAAGTTAYCRANFLNLMWHLGTIGASGTARPSRTTAA
jgi:hypothetical protein